jgi:predicted RNA methylase
MPTASPHTVADMLRRRQYVRDMQFDRVYPNIVQEVSARYWTPVSVALTGAEWLRAAHCQSLLDVGSGAGKFCIVTRLAAGCAVQGIEQRPGLVQTARAAAVSYQAEVCFEQGTIEQVDPGRVDAFYFYNPFGENHYLGADRFDEEVELSNERYIRDIAIVESWLDRASRGTCVLTYHGFGGRIPDTYSLVHRKLTRGGALRLWVKRRAGRARGFSLELGDSTVSSSQLEELSHWVSSGQEVRELLERPFA